MGSACTMICPKCGYEFKKSEGVGFMFPKVYQETVHEAKNGELGEEIQQFFSEHPDGAINVDVTTLICDECGGLSSRRDLTMYVLKGEDRPDNNIHVWSVAAPFEGEDYVMSEDLKKYYRVYMKYPHKCKTCGGNMHIAGNKEKLMCPDCKIPLEIGGFMCWD